MSGGGPIFVLGLMRSGTTFVQRVLNCHPNVTVWGEHGGALRPLLTGLQPFEFDDHHRERIAYGYKRRKAVVGRLRDPGAFDAYVSPVPPEVYESLVDDVVRRRMTEIFTAGLPEGVRWGFKETRYAGNVYGPLARVFPDATFVFVTRAPASWMSSVVRARFRTDLRPDQLDDDRAVDEALGKLRDLWIRRTRTTLGFVEADAAHRVLVAQERLRTASAAQALSDRIGLDSLPASTLKNVLDRRAGSSDEAAEWQGDAKTRLESAIARVLDSDGRVDALGARVNQLSLV